MSNLKFLKKLNKLKPELKLVSTYIKGDIPIVVEDINGIQYKAVPYSMFLYKSFSFDSVVNKNEYFFLSL